MMPQGKESARISKEGQGHYYFGMTWQQPLPTSHRILMGLSEE